MKNLFKIQLIRTYGYRQWLHIGDIDKLDKKENFTITERIKELIITASSANMTLIQIQSKVKRTMTILFIQFYDYL
ncbi:unnamed protein product (macronuclear) [Paramecium tetraurelia]|uniref:Uncharacterized protein n=1 Tax=Paramecium tetraurelia TaxID=5888 RepID=A0DV52_PARTE|nr:uncharacterized protein GSPATT00020582001 [Paramecium tetraurelia]CAK86919.1 unnamed protein product [Paramecium tetraurelia]|eukprot:XP_001454316.1 hypothetical protein (macronuclear) [Paramecium tetraurelia strain d4-2]